MAAIRSIGTTQIAVSVATRAVRHRAASSSRSNVWLRAGGRLPPSPRASWRVLARGPDARRVGPWTIDDVDLADGLQVHGAHGPGAAGFGADGGRRDRAVGHPLDDRGLAVVEARPKDADAIADREVVASLEGGDVDRRGTGPTRVLDARLRLRRGLLRRDEDLALPCAHQRASDCGS